MDGGAWWTAVYGVSQSQTRLKRLSSSSSSSDCSHEIKRLLLLGRKVMTNLDSIFKNRDITLPNETVRWHHQHNGHGFGWTPGVGDGQGGLVCCGSWGCKESDTLERLN